MPRASPSPSSATAPKGVPVVTATGSKGTTPGALQSSLALLQALPADLSGDVTSLTVSSADLVTFTLGSRTVVWGSGEELDPQGGDPAGPAAHEGQGHRRQRPGHAGDALTLRPGIRSGVVGVGRVWLV